MKQHRSFPYLTAALSLCLALALAWGGYCWEKARLQQARLQEIYTGALLSAKGQMEDIRLALMKSMISQDGAAAQQYLNRAGSGAAQVQRSLALLPLSHSAAQNALKFANQLADYTALLITEGALQGEDRRQLQLLCQACLQSAQALEGAGTSLAGEMAAAGQPFYPAADAAPGYDSDVAYPSLIYDGPFSDALAADAPRGLPDTPVTREQARQIAREFVGGDQVIRLTDGADIGGSIPCYGVTLQLKDVTLEAAVTKQGGKILLLSPDTADFTPEKTLENCKASALSFLESRGFPPMEPADFQAYQGVMVISFVPLQGDTLLYPDLIKVQLRMDTGHVVGLEARHYYLRHHPRGLLTPSLTQEEAQGAVSPYLNIQSTRLCLIPRQQREILCYEFRGEYQGQTYLVYINGQTGEQEELLQVQESNAGIQTI